MLYALANITVEETKLIKFELFKFFQYWIKCQKNSDLHKLQSQFIGVDKHDLPVRDQAPVLYDILHRFKIYDAWHMLCFIVVSDNKEFPIHIDDMNPTWTAVGLNVPVLNCQDSKTVWYDTIPEKNPKMPGYISELTPHANVTAARCVSTDAKEIGSCDANIPHWVNISVPHAPVCIHKKLRINSSLRFQFDCNVQEFFVDTRYQHCMIKTLSQ